MDTWSEGYVSDINYTYGYYPELNPARVRLAFLNSGLALPTIGTACELGFGQGMSVNMHAAASMVRWYGTDFNPSQAGLAQSMAAAAGSGAQLTDEAFADYCHRTDLPDFDYIGLHGIWSWVSDANRTLIVDFVRRKLKVGGVLYISYNTMPGWAASAPVRRLLADYAASMNTIGEGTISRVNSALDFANQLMAVNPVYLGANPQVKAKVESLANQNRNYLAHEYFNRDWNPMYFSDMARWLGPAKVSFACSAAFLDHIDQLAFKPEQQKLLDGIPDATLRQTVRDYLVNQQFRRDYWVKGPRPLQGFEQADALREQRVVLVARRADVKLKFTSTVGEANLSEAVYQPLLDALGDHLAHSLGQLESALVPHGVGFRQLVQAVMVLGGMGKLEPAQAESDTRAAKAHVNRLNEMVMKKSRDSGDLAYLASPVTGGGIAAERIQQLFLLAIAGGATTPDEWVAPAWKILSALGQKLIKDGKPLESDEDNLAELRARAHLFASDHLPIFQALQVV